MEELEDLKNQEQKIRETLIKADEKLLAGAISEDTYQQLLKYKLEELEIIRKRLPANDNIKNAEVAIDNRNDAEIDEEFLEKSEKLLDRVRNILEEHRANYFLCRKQVSQVLDEGLKVREPRESGVSLEERKSADLAEWSLYEKFLVGHKHFADLWDDYFKLMVERIDLTVWRLETQRKFEPLLEFINTVIPNFKKGADGGLDSTREGHRKMLEKLQKTGARISFAWADMLMAQGQKIKAEEVRKKGNLFQLNMLNFER